MDLEKNKEHREKRRLREEDEKNRKKKRKMTINILDKGILRRRKRKDLRN